MRGLSTSKFYAVSAKRKLFIVLNKDQTPLTEEEISEAEWAVVQILSHPVMFREFINQDTPGWEPLEDHEREWSTCNSTYIAMCCGRGVHKTTSMIEMLYFWMI